MQPDYRTNTVKEEGTPTMAKKTEKKTKNAAAKPKVPVSAEARAKAISKTWADPKVAAARASHHGVKVAGEIYRSVKAAFAALKLPMGRRGPFRRALKAEGIGGSLVFEHDGKKTKFTLIEVPSLAASKAKAEKPKTKKAAPKAKAKKAAATAEEAPAAI